MYTLVDFITHIKGVEYILSLLAIAVFLVFWEVLKTKPFRTVVNTGQDDLDYIVQAGGFKGILKAIRKIAAAPFIGLAYIIILPFGFLAALAVAAMNLAMKGVASVVGKSAGFEWRPMEAYLAGKKKKGKTTAKAQEDDRK
jgi:hypothetical protein